MSDIGQEILEKLNLNKMVDDVAEDLGIGPLSDEQKIAVAMGVTAAAISIGILSVEASHFLSDKKALIDQEKKLSYHYSSPEFKPVSDRGERMAWSICISSV